MTRQDAQVRIEKLRKEINRHRYLYHVRDRSEISDAALDSLKRELEALEREFPDLVNPDSPSQRVGGKPLPGFKKVRHSVPMLSLNDAFSEEELAEWEQRIKKIASGFRPYIADIEYFTETKVDGFAISLIYRDGVLVRASTRGDGYLGEDVTENVKTIESVPLRLHLPEEFVGRREIRARMKKFPRVAAAVSRIPKMFEVRGEIYMAKSAFAEINREQAEKGLPLFANPRNIASGSVRALDPRVTAARRLDFLAYDLVSDLGQATHEEEHMIANFFGFRTVALAARCKDIGEVVAFWKKILLMREQLPLLIDGIVAQVNSGYLFERLGVAGKAPRGAIAFKFPADEATSVVQDIIVQVGRTGVLTPVAVLRPVMIAGVRVSRATLHNMDEIERLDVRVGDTVIVQRAGDVIPAIVRVLKKLRKKGAQKFRMPRRFCGQAVARGEGEAAYRILHPEECELVTREKLYHFVSKPAFDIQGLGPKIIDRLIDEGLMRDPADLFLLQEEDIGALERFGAQSAKNLVSAVRAKKEIPLAKFLYALGILHVGEETALDLAAHFGKLEKIMVSSASDLTAVPNIGVAVAKSIVHWFGEKQNVALVQKLLQVGVRVKKQKYEAESQKLKGLTFVLTGGLEALTRDEARARIRKRGGDVAESVSRNTDFVVAGADPGSKLDRAKNFGVKRITEKEFLAMIGDGSV